MFSLYNNISQKNMIEIINQEMVSLSEQVSTLLYEVGKLKNMVAFAPEWISLDEVATQNDISKQQLNRRVVESGLYTPNKQFKYMNNEMYIHISVVPSLKRKRKHKEVK